MIPSSPLSPFTPAILATMPAPDTTPVDTGTVPGEDENPMAPMAPLATPLPGVGAGQSSYNWTANTQANGFDLAGVGDLSVDSNVFLGTGPSKASLQGDPSGDLQVISPAQMSIQGQTINITGAVRTLGNLTFDQLPTSATGLPSGGVWNNAGVLNIVP